MREPVLTETADGRWVPSVPLPLYVRGWRTLFRWRYQCSFCAPFLQETTSGYLTEAGYRKHWRNMHAPLPDGRGGWSWPEDAA